MQHATVSFSNGNSEPLTSGKMEEKELAVQSTQWSHSELDVGQRNSEYLGHTESYRSLSFLSFWLTY